MMIQRQLAKLDERRLLRLVLLAVVLTGAASLSINALTAASLGSEMIEWLESWLLDVSTDLAGGGAVFALLRLMMQGRSQDEAPTAATFFSPMTPPGGYIEATQMPAVPEPSLVEELKHANTPEARQWILNRLKLSLRAAHLVDCNLERAHLVKFDLQGADLTKARLRAANLVSANLRRANLTMTQLIEANLQDADLREAVLVRAFLSGADLRGASLVGATLQTSLWGVQLVNADLEKADLRGAELFRTNLTGANLAGALLDNARINRDTVLPDGKNWEPKDDLRRFTDAQHPRFWRSDDPVSPAFRG